MDKEILKRIKESRKEYDYKLQRVELLKRNKAFLNELKGISKRLGAQFFAIFEKDLTEFGINLNVPPGIEFGSMFREDMLKENHILLQMDYPKANIVEYWAPLEELELARLEAGFYGEYGDGYPEELMKRDSYFDDIDLDVVFVYDVDLYSHETEIKCKWIVLERYLEKWEEFCKKWNLYPSWNGRITNLEKHLRGIIDIEFNERDRHMPIHIKMNPWATKEDLENRWNEVQEIKKKIFNKNKKSHKVFGKHLCWYDLYKDKKLSYAEIAKYWEKALPEDVDLMVLKYIEKEEAPEEIEFMKQELSMKNIEDKELLKEIKIGKLQKKFSEYFEECKELYISGKGESRGKKRHVIATPPFLRTIKKAIEDTEKYINSSKKVIEGYESESLFKKAINSFPSPEEIPKKFLK